MKDSTKSIIKDLTIILSLILAVLLAYENKKYKEYFEAGKIDGFEGLVRTIGHAYTIEEEHFACTIYSKPMCPVIIHGCKKLYDRR